MSGILAHRLISLDLRILFLFCSYGVKVAQQQSELLLPPMLRDGPPETLGDAMVRGDHVWLRCRGCRHVAVIRPEVLAQFVGYDCKLVALRRRLRCGMCGAKRVRIGGVVPGKDDEGDTAKAEACLRQKASPCEGAAPCDYA
jgi:hypothetical protein